MQTLRSMYRLIKLCTATREGKIGIIFFVVILALNILEIKLTLKLINWNKDFYNALEKYDASAALTQIGIFALLTFFISSQYLIGNYLRGLLQIRWRKELTNASFDRWFKGKAYWHMSASSTTNLDNPDQRVAEDCRIFIDKLTTKALELITKVLGLATYFIVLWNVATFTLSFKFFGYDISIPHYMVWAAPIYVLICSGMTHWLGAPLMKISVEQQHKEADFRFALTRFRESKEAIALHNGEEVEREILNKRFDSIIHNWRSLIKREFILGSFTRPYMSTILRIPVFLALPAYLIGHFTLGSLMQISSAFQNVVTNLSWFIFSYRDLVELAASSVRLERFLSQAKQSALNENEQLTTNENNNIEISKLKLYSLDNKPLASLPHAMIAPKQTTILRGKSGIGKSTLIKTLAGVHRYFDGKITLPKGNKMFLSQKAYFPLGGLADAVSYPQLLKEDASTEIKEILSQVGFSSKEIEERWVQCDATQLSGGEQQRVIIARALFNKPDWLFMDECTNALDTESERELLELLQRSLPNTTLVMVSHSSQMNQQLGTSTEISLSYS